MTVKQLTVKELIERLRTLPQGAPVELEILEPYDDDAELLSEPLTTVRMKQGKVVLA